MRILKRLVLAGALAASTSISFAEDSAALPEKEKFHLYLLVGQSNMAGRGKVTPEDKKPHDRVMMLTKDLKWVPATDPMHFDKSIAGVGLGRTFGMEMAEADPSVTIGLIPCAVGGSPILAWEPGGYHESTKTHPWDDMLPRAKAALGKGTLKGILWHQGESDSGAELAPLYEKRLHALVARLRAELDAPDVPFIAGAMGNWPEKPWNEWKRMVDQAHRDLSRSVPNSAYVSAEGLAHRDEVHFNRESYIEFGKRYAEALRALQSASNP
ncbi:sialate O-acetylesterase [Verrucomicrobiales bacterium BCK34]|nr:sialate O-acetylesterase [Verrucomicrobiales bacterium BCK34]